MFIPVGKQEANDAFMSHRTVNVDLGTNLLCVYKSQILFAITFQSAPCAGRSMQSLEDNPAVAGTQNNVVYL